MHPLTREVIRFLRAEQGPTAVEYAVMMALIIVVCFAAVASLGKTVEKKYSNEVLNAALK